MPPITRRKFFKRSSYAGIGYLVSAWSFPQYIVCKTGSNETVIKKKPKPVCKVVREVHVPYPELRKAPITSMTYIGRGMKREETRSFMRSSDWTESIQRRISEDNGHTWSEWIPVLKETQSLGEFTESGGPSNGGSGPYDPVSGNLIKPVFQRILKGVPEVALKEIWRGNRLFWDHGYYQLSGDNGNTWGEAFQLKYEDGADFDSSDWGKQDFLWKNEMYIGNAAVLKNGSVIICATVPVPYNDPEDMKYPSIFPNNYREGHVAGAMCFVGRWNATRMNYDWKNSNSIFLPRQVSSRGLVELNICELKNGNLLLIMRGSNAGLDITKSPGRKWFSVSRDGGLTWEKIKDMQYDTGEQFFSPATIHETIRSSKTGKLYWIGNINNVPSNGNGPRYPLQIVELDENEPSFKKHTVTVIDDRDTAHDSEFLQLSNFSLLEDMETKNMEIYLTRLGENGGGPDIWTANSYKYTLTF
jgi:hypothetical protein